MHMCPWWSGRRPRSSPRSSMSFWRCAGGLRVLAWPLRRRRAHFVLALLQTQRGAQQQGC